ncbi:MAG: 2-hydroxy-3-oxopropionate reductase, partial [Nitrosopumilaceae archaeon]|nr:2-hydroxy-3-oxopropionate reductase [Nitrosopumilaceae archaeon]NIU88406.1 2-hydroxy-3-oxopropionate reductase [Nitrosopumilaceae archaeon]NIV66680.1 2-hydroxy-3-oxopropionate reductase [Nitrosopumilaceae archaeon]NIX62619.1 2-hydroxy-3-oxopropionate reductase [Nitrosopumilaceae archaeon]
FPLTVWNRTRSKMDELIEAGANAADSPREVAENSEIIVTIVTDSSDVKQVILGDEG